MEQSVQPVAARCTLRESLINTIEYIESVPLMRPHWAAFDVAILVMLFLR